MKKLVKIVGVIVGVIITTVVTFCVTKRKNYAVMRNTADYIRNM